MAPVHGPIAILRDDAVTLRPWVPADAPALARACGEPEITRHTTVPERFSVPAAEAWIGRQIARTERRDALILAVVPAGRAQPVGMAGLFGLAEDDGPRLGYWIVREHRGRGLATRAAALLVAWAAEHGHRHVGLEVEPHNAASLAIARHLSATPRGRHTVRLDDGREVVLDRFVVRP
jgi:RimJ/RimL family protein N-acetyltransferase